MGEHLVHDAGDAGRIRAFTRAMLADLRALERLLERGMIEQGVRRMGAEQEMFLVDADCRPAPVGDEILKRVADPRFTTELARFNLEANLPPRHISASFLREMEADLEDVLRAASAHAESLGARVLLVGILPTLRETDLGLDNMTPELRYQQMNDAISRMRGGAFPVRIDGIEEFNVVYDSVMIESANTSLQLHLQVGVDEFPRLYNLAQLVTAPLLAAATFSPVLLGRRLWHETRVALFERSIDERSSAQSERGMPSRVSFGNDWVHESVLEVFRDNAARFHVIMTREAEADPAALVERGEAPALSALCLHNGTVWRWNRPCYGVTDGIAHLRIENRVLPAGPTVLDEVANAALFYGMMLGLEDAYGNVAARLDFESAKANFSNAARHGLDTHFTWLDDKRVSAQELLLEELIPAARDGLRRVGVPAEDLQRYLNTVEERVRSGRTGSRWLLDSLARAAAEVSHEQRLRIVTAAALKRQNIGDPVHCWDPAQIGEVPPDHGRPRTVRDVMTTDVFTVHPDDVVDLATSVMEWRHIRHVPVEDYDGTLVGLLSMRALLGTEGARTAGDEAVAVEAIMSRDFVAVDPDTALSVAAQKMLASASGCLLAVNGGRLVGILTERDLLKAATDGIERKKKKKKSKKT